MDDKTTRETYSPYQESVERVAALLESDLKAGLTEAQIAPRREQFGPNQLPARKREPAWRRLLKQFQNLLIVVLMVAAVLAGTLGEWLEVAVILAVVAVNVLIGFIQEGKAEKALQGIQSMLAEQCVVVRNGVKKRINSDDLVPGDLVMLEPGDKVPADIRLSQTSQLAIQEAALTGESVAVDKQTGTLAGPNNVARNTAENAAENTAKSADKGMPPAVALAERNNMAFAGTLVTQGQGFGVVVATGSDTELGRVNQMLANVERLTTPLLRQMGQFARYLTFIVILVGVLVFALGLARGNDASYMFMAVVSLVVAAIPEGLPTILTVALAIGVTRMASRHAIIRRLPAVETIGAVSVICSDKTGTLTRNEMTVTQLRTPQGVYQVSGAGYAPEGELRPVDHQAPLAARVLDVAAHCHDARLLHKDGQYVVEGDPMEGALLTLVAKARGGNLAAIPEAHHLERVGLIPFDSQYKYMATAHETSDGSLIAFVKGAPEAILQRCDSLHDSAEPLDTAVWLEHVDTFAGQGNRVLALACKRLRPQPGVANSQPEGTLRFDHQDIEQSLELVALVAIMDPPRDEAIQAVEDCHEAGITVKMITGDHGKTATAIGRMLHLTHTDTAITGTDIDQMSDAQLSDAIASHDVFARTTPAHKLRLVTLLQAQQNVVAMTGDGVNDAPALKRADIGIAMGKGGTAAAREASEMVLTDDNFASIVKAVYEGRTVYDNLKKALTFLLPVNGGESLAIILALLLGLALPIMPLQILWVNMVSSIALALALAFEASEPDTMKRAPRRATEPWLSGFILWRILLVSLLFTAGIFAVFEWAQAQGYNEAYARTMAVNTLVAMEVWYLFSVRYLRRRSFTLPDLKGTPPVLLAVCGVFVLQLLFTYSPWLQALFNTQPLRFVDGLLCVGIGILLFVLLEIEKWLQRRYVA